MATSAQRLATLDRGTPELTFRMRKAGALEPRPICPPVSGGRYLFGYDLLAAEQLVALGMLRSLYHAGVEAWPAIELVGAARAANE